MSTRPRLLDLFCGAGGASVGYARAGFEVVGVDLVHQPRYPFEFVQADAIDVLDVLASDQVLHGTRFQWLDGIDAIHASPPCQAFTQMSARWRGRSPVADGHADLLTPTLAVLRALGKPYVAENVQGAHAHMSTTLTLHGGMFGLEVHRPRRFECSELILAPKAALCREPVGVYGERPDGNRLRTRLNGDMKGRRSLMRAARSLEEAQRVMGMPWANWRECCEAIPPAYTEHIGAQLLDALAWHRTPGEVQRERRRRERETRQEAAP